MQCGDSLSVGGSRKGTVHQDSAISHLDCGTVENCGRVRRRSWGAKIKAGFGLVEFEWEQKRDANRQFEIPAAAEF